MIRSDMLSFSAVIPARRESFFDSAVQKDSGDSKNSHPEEMWVATSLLHIEQRLSSKVLTENHLKAYSGDKYGINIKGNVRRMKNAAQ